MFKIERFPLFFVSFSLPDDMGSAEVESGFRNLSCGIYGFYCSQTIIFYYDDHHHYSDCIYASSLWDFFFSFLILCVDRKMKKNMKIQRKKMKLRNIRHVAFTQRKKQFIRHDLMLVSDKTYYGFVFFFFRFHYMPGQYRKRQWFGLWCDWIGFFKPLFVCLALYLSFLFDFMHTLARVKERERADMFVHTRVLGLLYATDRCAWI